MGTLNLAVTFLPNQVVGTDRFNWIESQLARPGIRPCQGLPSPVRPAVETGLLHVLVVDDDRDTADVMALLIDTWGHEVQRAYDGDGALSLAARQAPDVVLLDIAMPRMNGRQVAERLRGDSRLRNCFVIAITGFAEAENRLLCRAAGIDLFLVKPVEAAVVETLLDLECARLGRSRRTNGSAREMAKPLPAGPIADDPWHIGPRGIATTAFVL
jgi:CheY-like chemotaxis protein